MGYVVRKLDSKNRTWKVQYVRYVAGKPVARDVPLEHYVTHGFNPQGTIEDAHIRRDQLNSLGAEQRHQESRLAITERTQSKERIVNAYLNEALVEEFEREVLYGRAHMDPDHHKKNKTASHWLAAKRLLTELKIDAIDWNYKQVKFYDWFTRQGYSISYLHKIFPLLNKWGHFQCRKRGQHFTPLDSPTGVELQRIQDAYLEKEGGGNESAPLTPEALEAAREKLKPEHYNWLYLSVWLGLRPHEVDRLLLPEGARTWCFQKEGDMPVLAVYQTKLKRLAHDQRTKRIPCFLPEQVAALKILKGQQFQRPLVKTLHLHFGPLVNTYGGRKGFGTLMRKHGQTILDYHKWMGHRTIDRTLLNYEDHQAIHVSPVRTL